MISLPVIDYSRFTKAQQVKKIGEEYGEVCEALLNDDPEEVIRESLDCIQTHWTLINMVVTEHGMTLDIFFEEHCQKLKDKGYLAQEG